MRPRRAGMREVVLDVGIVFVEGAGGRIVIVAFLGHGQADDGDRWAAQRIDQRGGVLGRDDNVLQAADDTQGLRLCPEIERVEVILRL